jgi:hypothetical protein
MDAIRGLCVAFAVAMGVVPATADAQTVVVGQNNPAVDVPAVQAAVNAGGSVILSGTFDFGDAGRVLVGNNVDIGGETDESGALLTTIRRGEWNFHTPYPTQMPPTVAGPIVSIHHLRFVQSRGTAIHLAYSGGCSLHDNQIVETRARRVNATVSERAAVVVGPSLLGGPALTTFFPLLVSGDIVVTDNVLNTTGPEPGTSMRGTGMFIAMYVGADVRVERNTVLGNTRTGLAILDGDFDANGRGSVLIADNTIFSDVVFGFVAAGPRAPIGIVTGFNNQRALGADPHKLMIPVLIQGNVMELYGKTSMGLVNIWNGAVINDNDITVHTDINFVTNRLSTSGGVLATASDQILMNNRISGEGCNAIRYGGTTDGQERFGDLSKANQVNFFEPFVGGFEKCATYWLEPASHDNYVIGNSGTVIDDGVDNKVTGAGPVQGGVGKAASEAEATTHELENEFDTFGLQ